MSSHRLSTFYTLFWSATLILKRDYNKRELGFVRVKEMSLGYCACAKIVFENGNFILYAYSGENWNEPTSNSGDKDLYDGEILINKDALVEPEIHKKFKNTQSGKKHLHEKRIIVPVNVSELINSGKIKILKTCKNEFSQNSCEYYLAQRIIKKIFVAYQEKGKLPDTCAFIQ